MGASSVVLGKLLSRRQTVDPHPRLYKPLAQRCYVIVDQPHQKMTLAAGNGAESPCEFQRERTGWSRVGAATDAKRA